MQTLLLAFLCLLTSIAMGEQPIGGCAGTMYGCCPDGKTPATGLKFLGCAQRHVAKSAECQAFLKKTLISCDTRTSCQDLECNETIAGIVQIHMEINVHKCREPPAIRVALQLNVLGKDYSWSHEFIGNASVFLPNFNLPIPDLPVPIQVIVAAHVYRRSNRDIHVTAAIEPVLVFSPGHFSPLFKYQLLNDSKIPVNTSDCYGPDNCYGNCSRNSCLLGDDGWVCYDCPPSCSRGSASQPVCGSDLVSYDSECSMKMNACKYRKAYQVLYRRSCSSTPPLTLLTEWPRSLISLPPATEQFIRVAVVFLTVSVPEDSVATYTSTYFSNKLSDVLGYQVIVPEITNSDRARRDTGGWVTLNVTIYAHYQAKTGNKEEVVVHSTQLLDDIQKNKKTLKLTLKVQSLEASLSFGAQSKTADSSSSSSSTTTIIIVVVVVVIGSVAAIAVLVGLLWYRRKKQANNLLNKDTLTLTLPSQDQLASS